MGNQRIILKKITTLRDPKYDYSWSQSMELGMDGTSYGKEWEDIIFGYMLLSDDRMGENEYSNYGNKKVQYQSAKVRAILGSPLEYGQKLLIVNFGGEPTELESVRRQLLSDRFEVIEPLKDLDGLLEEGTRTLNPRYF